MNKVHLEKKKIKCVEYLVGFGHELAIIIVPKSSILRVTKSPHLLKTLVSSQPLLVCHLALAVEQDRELRPSGDAHNLCLNLMLHLLRQEMFQPPTRYIQGSPHRSKFV